MDGFVSAGLLNAALATLLAIGAIAATAVWRNPYAVRLVWLAVLLKLVAPPLLFVPVEATWLEQFLEPSPATTFSATDAAAVNDQRAASPPLADAARAYASLGETNNAAATFPAVEGETSVTSAEENFAVDFHWRDLLLPLGVAWVVGSVGLATLAIVRIWRFQRLVAQSAVAAPALQAKTAGIASRLGLRMTPQVRIVAGRIAPLAWTLGRRSTIILPATLMKTLDREALDAVIAHELTHVRRRDGWARWLELAAVVAYWWCPTAWFARKRIHEAEELCCDADVLRQFPGLRRGYGRAMLETLELLASDAALAPGATGWGSRRSLRRRFERIGRGEAISTLGSWKRRSCWAAIVLLCLLAPTAISSEQAPATPEETTVVATTPDSSPVVETAATDAQPIATVEDAQACTVMLNDGTIISGMLVDEGDERLVVVRDKQATGNAASTQRLDPGLLGTANASLQPWDLTLKECLRLALENHQGFRVTTADTTGELLTLAQTAEKPQSLTTFASQAEDLVRDVASSYWELHFAMEDVAVRRESQMAALKLWRQAKKRYSAMEQGGTAADESQARGQFFLFQSQLESAHANLLRIERRLRWLMGIASYDGRVIRPSTPIKLTRDRIDWPTAEKQALAKRVELREQVKRVEERQRRQREAEALVVEKENPTLPERRNLTTARHLTLLALREAAVLKDMQLTVSHQLADAVRDLDLKYGMTQINGNRCKAAKDEFAAVEASYDVGRVTLDLLLQSQQRTAEAAAADERSRVDYQQADLQFHRRQGTLLETLGIRIAE